MTVGFDLRVFDEHAEVCKVLAHPKRLMILYLLSGGERSVSNLADSIGIPIANVSQHLSRLKAAGLVRCKKNGQAVIYSITDERIPRACDLIRATLLERLRSQAQLAERIEGTGPMEAGDLI